MILFNTLTRNKEEFLPLSSSEILMYVCGITPNNAAHLGHAFTYVSFDVLVRYLRYKGMKVNYLQNATDLNDSDDVIKQAEIAGRTWKQEAKFWIDRFHEQMDDLNILRPTSYVLATSVMQRIVEITKKLVDDDFAYEKNGNVYFRISKFKTYGELSKFNSDQMLYISRDRGNNEDDPNKENPLDFVLWYSDPSEPSWESPWGKGRPGWHIECSTMIYEYLGTTIDIHGGGRDLMYPHHENEIAQSESFTGEKFVNTWMHTGMVLYEGEKMSKSLGNLVLMSDVLKKYSSFAIRWLLLSHHYRAPWEYEEMEMREVEEKVTKILRKLSSVDIAKKPVGVEFESIMEDDLNTPKVLELVERLIEENKKSQAKNILEILGFVL